MAKTEQPKKTLHVTEITLEELQNLKRQMGLKSLSDVVDSLIQLYKHTGSFPREYVEFVGGLHASSGKDDKK